MTLMRWYRAGVDVERRLPALSTYLGHSRLTDTYWYLQATPKLLGFALARVEKGASR
jgi:integrase/recombinase XerD